VIPPTDDVAAVIESVMAPFNENGEDEDGERYSNTFWDFYVIGGRWAGAKQMAKYDKAKIAEFEAWMQVEKVTVSGVTAGKQTLQPDSQRAKVDDKWNALFPSEKFVPCPMFSHSNDQYAKAGPLSGAIDGDVMRLADLPAGYECGHIIFAGPRYDEKATIATFMLTDTAWNGVNHMKTKWDGTVASALAEYRERIGGYRDDYREKVTPTDDWLVVTVDYHS
jgi:hypothetical protein